LNITSHWTVFMAWSKRQSCTDSQSAKWRPER